LNGEGVDTGRFAVSYSESVDEGASLKDIPGIGGGAAVSFGFGGFDVSYSEKGLQMIGIHLGYGAGASARGEATAVISSRHGKIGWNNRSAGGETAVKPEKKRDR
jgi:hypothetical protein